jgi:hypothetical protein
LVTSETLPGVQRQFDSFSGAEREASLSRVFAGVHFLSDETTGQSLGHQLASSVLDRFLLP